jgi:DNA-binding MarR family transcriptional regulator
MNTSRENAVEHYSSKNYTLTGSVGYVLVKARNLIIAEMDAALKDFGITTQQMSILLALKGGVASTPFELSKLLGIDTGLMTRILDKLETNGLLGRSRDAEDRRVVNLRLTEKGAKIAARVPEIAPQVLNARLRSFTKAEFEQLNRLLRKFIGD